MVSKWFHRTLEMGKWPLFLQQDVFASDELHSLLLVEKLFIKHMHSPGFLACKTFMNWQIQPEINPE